MSEYKLGFDKNAWKSLQFDNDNDKNNNNRNEKDIRNKRGRIRRRGGC